MELLMDVLRNWNKATSEREKLQHVYIFIIIVVAVASGLIALVNNSLGHTLIVIAGIALIAFLANSVVWAIAQTYLFSHLDRKRTPKK